MTLLVAYASKMGSTAEIAEAVAKTLREDGFEVDCVSVDEVSDLDPYEAVVIGSAVYAKRWRGDAKHFLRKHRKALASMPFWVFSSGPVGDPADDDPDWMEPPKIVAKVSELGGRGHVVFGGSVPAEPEGFVAKSMAKNVPPEFQDRRDWGEIRAWAQKIAAELAPHSA